MIMLNHLPAQLNTFKAIKQEKSYKNSTLFSTTNLINQIKEHACHINQENIVNFHKTKFRDNAQSKSNNNHHKFRNQDILKCNDCSAKHLMKKCFYTHLKLAPKKWQSNKEMKEKVAKKKAADKKKSDDKNKKKEDRFKSDVTMIYYHYTFSFALNINALPEAFKKITNLMPFIKALINNKVIINKTIMPFSSWKIIVDSEATGHIFFNKNFIFDFKFISFYMKIESGELLQCLDCSKIKIDFKSLNGNIDVIIKDII